MSAAKRKRTSRDDPLAPYRRIRRPMPPPERVIGDRRHEIEDDEARPEIDDPTPRRTSGDEQKPNEEDG